MWAVTAREGGETVDDVLKQPPLLTGQCAFFFDVDGSLTEIQPHPALVTLSSAVLGHLARIFELSNGALALISGRSLTDLDNLTAPVRFPAAGLHGAERRDISGIRHDTVLPPTMLAHIQDQLEALIAENPGTMLEFKGTALAVHYRHALQREGIITRQVKQIIAPYPAVSLQPGKCVLEVKPQGVNKGESIREFMNEYPFKERTPVFIGDDLTDEAGFNVVNQYQGVSIKVGEGATCALFRLASVTHVEAWLSRVGARRHEQEARSAQGKGGQQ